MLIFERSQTGRKNLSQLDSLQSQSHCIPERFLRHTPPLLPEVSEMQTVRHYTQLSQKNFSIDTQFYPLGSCTMKYNPRAAHKCASLPGFVNRHPLAPPAYSQGVLACLFELSEILKAVTGMAGVSCVPMAGAQGELAGVSMIRAYHHTRGDFDRTIMLVPDSAHGTNPASAAMCGFTIQEIPTQSDGDIDLNALRKTVGPKTAGIMLTNPSTLGLFERNILSIAQCVHEAGGLLYYDGANLNAILGRIKPMDMGFDVLHLNLHKTFGTPHGGGGPGAGPVAANARLAPYLPIPLVGQKNGATVWLEEEDCPQTIGRLSTFMGNVGVLLRAYVYAKLLGGSGLERVSEFATLNANYLRSELKKMGFDTAYPSRRATHEFIVTLKRQKEALGISAMDVAKRLLDYGFHAPTTYFPLLVPECLLIEPTETESKEELDHFVKAMGEILKEAESDPDLLHQAPHHLPVRRLDDVKAARELDVVWKGGVK